MVEFAHLCSCGGEVGGLLGGLRGGLVGGGGGLGEVGGGGLGGGVERLEFGARLMNREKRISASLVLGLTLLLSSLLPTRGTGHPPARTTRTGALRD